MGKMKEIRPTITFQEVSAFLAEGSGADFRGVDFASNVFNSTEAERFLRETLQKVSSLGGKVFVERRSDLSREIYSDTMLVWLPYLSKLPSLINRTEIDYMNVAMIRADEVSILDVKQYVFNDPYVDSTNPEVLTEDGIVLRYWWD